MSTWFKKLPPNAQKAYLKKHPRSRIKGGARPTSSKAGSTASKSSTGGEPKPMRWSTQKKPTAASSTKSSGMAPTKMLTDRPVSTPTASRKAAKASNAQGRLTSLGKMQARVKKAQAKRRG